MFGTECHSHGSRNVQITNRNSWTHLREIWLSFFLLSRNSHTCWKASCNEFLNRISCKSDKRFNRWYQVIYIYMYIYTHTHRAGYVVGIGLPTGWTVRGSNPGGSEILRTCPGRHWGPPSLLYNGYRVFPRGKLRPGRDADPSPLLVSRSKME
jgi:hypothetical protein